MLKYYQLKLLRVRNCSIVAFAQNKCLNANHLLSNRENLAKIEKLSIYSLKIQYILPKFQ